MLPYIVKRLLWSIPVLLLVSGITFILMHMVAGGPWSANRSDRPVSKAAQENLNRKYGLDRPLAVQYVNYMANIILHGDFGISYDDPRTVNKIIAQDFPVSAALGIVALTIGIGLGIPFGLMLALHHNSLLDRLGTVLVTAITAIPNFVIAIFLIILFAVNLHLLPVQFYRDRWQSWILPVGLLALRIFALIARLMRAATVDILGSDYIRTAHMKGLRTRRIYVHHILRNAILPVMTIIGPLAADVLTGSFIIESMFGIPGIGRTFVTSIVNRDYSLLMGVTLFFAFVLIGFNLLVDLSYVFIDPRIAHS